MAAGDKKPAAGGKGASSSGAGAKGMGSPGGKGKRGAKEPDGSTWARKRLKDGKDGRPGSVETLLTKINALKGKVRTLVHRTTFLFAHVVTVFVTNGQHLGCFSWCLILLYTLRRTCVYTGMHI